MSVKISVIVPCYNQAQYLPEALQSVLDQSYTHWECIIINDGSTDNTEAIANNWTKKDDRFKYVYQANLGVSSARNLGIEMAIGTFILPLDADDKIAANYLELALKEFKANSHLTLVYSKAEKFGDEVGQWDLKPFSINGLSHNNMIFCSALFKKKEWKRVGGYDVNMAQGLEDWEFWIALLKNGGEVKCLNIIGFYYRVKEVSRQQQMKPQNYKAMFNYISVKHADFFVRELGSFVDLNNKIKHKEQKHNKKLKSKKFVLNLFCKTFLGFSLFKALKDDE